MPAESTATRVRASGQAREGRGEGRRGTGQPEGDCPAPSNADQGPNPPGTPLDPSNREEQTREGWCCSRKPPGWPPLPPTRGGA
eukprot:5987373-Alexandrium_andersonii.AAC.1